MDNISNTGTKNLYNVTLDFITIDNDIYDISKSVHIYTKDRMEEEKTIYISIDENVTIQDFYQATNIADSMIEILENYRDPDTIIINIVPYRVRCEGDNQLANRLTSIYEYLGFREFTFNDNDIVMVYMNSAGIRIFNVGLDRKEYDYGK